MSEKDKITVSLTPENVEWIDANHNNRSAFIDDLITDYREGTSQADDVVAQYRLRQLEAEQASLKKQLEVIEEQKEAVAETVTTKEQRREQQFDEAAEKLHEHQLEEDNPGVNHLADEIGVETETLIAEVKKRLDQ